MTQTQDRAPSAFRVRRQRRSTVVVIVVLLGLAAAFYYASSYFSATAPRTFGAGDKTTHNAVGDVLLSRDRARAGAVHDRACRRAAQAR